MTGLTLAVNEVVVEPAATVTPAGTFTALLLLERETATPPLGAAADRPTVQLSAKEPVIDVLLQEIAEMTCADLVSVPVPLRLTVAVPALLAIDNCPVAAPVEPGSNRTVSVTCWPGLSVEGSPPPKMEKPLPEIAWDLMATAAEPLDVSVTDFVTAVPSETLPKASEDVLKLRVGTEDLVALNWKSTLFEEPSALAEMTAVCALLTAATLAVNEAEVEPEETVTADGTATALLLLASATLKAFFAISFSDTLHVVFPAPANELFAQAIALSAGTVALVSGAAMVMAKDFAIFPCVAVRVAVSAALTADDVAVKFAVDEPAGTVAEAGTLRAELLLESFTTNPPAEAAEFVEMVQVSVVDPAILVLSQLNPLSSAAEAEPEPAPLPCRRTEAAGAESEAAITFS